jgi:tRNA1Val (adenine37-N6)-methyltransferase
LCDAQQLFPVQTIHHSSASQRYEGNDRQLPVWRLGKLLDIGAGTGLLPLMLAQKNTIEIDAVEMDEDAAQQATENILNSPWHSSIRLHHQNILAFPLRKQYNFIISNPPFYENELPSQHAKKNLAHHSSALSLAQVAECIAKGLEEDGIFFLLLPHKRLHESEQLLHRQGLFPSHRTRHAPFRIMLKGGAKATSVTETELSICDEHQQYTHAFITLLKDYYLYL